MINQRILVICESKDDYNRLCSLLSKLDIPENQLTWKPTVERADSISADTVFIETTDLELLKRLKDQNPEVSALVISEQTDLQEVQKALGAGADDFLTKNELTEASLYSALKRCQKQHEIKVALKRSNERLENIARATSDVLYDWDLKYNKIIWGDTLKEHFGYHYESVNSIQKLIEKIHPDDMAAMLQWVEKIVTNNYEANETQNIFRLKKSNGNFINVNNKAIVLEDSSKKPYRVIGAMENATLRLETESKIKASEERYSLLFHKTPIAKCIFRISDLVIKDINEAAVNQYGYTIDEFTALTIADLYPKEEFAPFISLISNLTARNEPLHCGQWRHIKKNGELFHVEIVGYSFEMNDELHVMITCNDITEKVKAAALLEEATERYFYVRQAIQDVVWDLDIEKKQFTLSENFSDIYGYEPEEISEEMHFWRDNIHPEDRDRVMASFYHALKTEDESWSYEYRYKRKNDEYAYVEDHAFILRDELDRAYRVIGSVRDVTERTKWQEELKLLESVVTNTNDAILITESTPIDKPGPRIIYANEGFHKQTGYKPEEVIGDTPRILQGPKTDRKQLDIVKQALKECHPCTIEVINYTKDNKEYYVEFSIDPVINESGQCTHFVSIQRDVTARKKQELEDELFGKIYSEMNSTPSIRGRFTIILRELSQFNSFDLAEGWITNLNNTELVKVADYTSSKKYEPFIESSRNFDTTKFDEGLPGIVCHAESITIWNDLGNNPKFIRRKEALKNKLTSAVAIPVFSHDKLIGCILFFSGSPIEEIDKNSTLNKLCQRLGPELKRMKIEGELTIFFNLSPDALCICNKYGQFVKVNPAFSKLTGYTEEELISRPFIDFVHPDDHRKTYTEFENLLKENYESKYFENRYITTSKDVIWLSWTATNVAEEQLIYAVAKNITEKKGLETLLQRTNQMAHVGHWELDLERQTVYWSDIMKEIHEVPTDYIPEIETSFDFYAEEEQKELVKAESLKLLKGQVSTSDLEFKIVTGKGKKRWVRAITEAEHENGRCIRIYGSFQDISDRKMAQVKLHEAYAEKENILASITDGFIALDTDWHVKYWNPTAEKIFDTPKKKILDKNLWKVFPQSKDFPFYNEYHKAMDSQSVRKFEQYFPAKRSWYEIMAYPSETGLTVHFKDITKRKNKEAELLEIRTLQNHVINSTTDFIWAIDKDYTLILANEAYLKGMKKFAGVTYKVGDKVISMTDKKWKVGEEERNMWQTNYKRALSGERVTFIMTVEENNKVKMQQQIALHPISHEVVKGKIIVTGVACFSRDLTERTKHVSAIQDQNQRLKEIAWLQSHVVRAPVAQILGLTKLMQLHKDNKEMLFDLSERITGSAQELDKIIGDISDKTQEVKDLE